MKGDIVRGLVELITNSDDSYGDDQKGRIRVEVEHRRNRPWQVIVRDRAKGMRMKKMETALGGLGEQTSGFERGENVRGNLGRGAKDLAAFGQVCFESISEGYYAKMVLEPDGSYEEPMELKATGTIRQELGISRGSGTVVTVSVAEHFRCQLHQTLVDRLSQHYQLRDINTDSRREITLVDLNSGAENVLRYSQASLPELLTIELSLEGYPDASATLSIFRNEERFENPSSDQGRPEGILIKGRRGVYENSLSRSRPTPIRIGSTVGWFAITSMIWPAITTSGSPKTEIKLRPIPSP